MQLNGYRSALFDAGIMPEKDNLIETDFTIEGCREAVLNYLNNCTEKPDAFLCPVDSMAVGCMRAISDHGLSCPGDIMVMSMMAEYYSLYTSPSLSTMPIRYDLICEEGMRAFDRMIRDPSQTSQSYIVPYMFSFQESTRG